MLVQCLNNRSGREIKRKNQFSEGFLVKFIHLPLQTQQVSHQQNLHQVMILVLFHRSYQIQTDATSARSLSFVIYFRLSDNDKENLV